LSPLHAAAVLSAGPDIIASLLEARACPHSRYNPRPGTAMYYVCLSASLSHRLGRRGVFTCVGYHVWNATPLLLASVVGAWPEAHILQEYKADANAANSRGAIAASLASFRHDDMDAEWLRSATNRFSAIRS